MPTVGDLQKTATQVRRDILRMTHGAQSGHPGGSLGCTDYFVALYYEIMKHDPSNFTMDGIGEATREARHAVGGAVERFESWGEDNLPGVAEAVRSQPFKACAISLGAGALIGALLLR